MRAVSPVVDSVGEVLRAVQDAELRLEYQGVLDLRRGSISSVEALVRWMHPRHGYLAPAAFLDVLDDETLGALLTREVLRLATIQAASWADAGLDLALSVNVAPATLPRVVDLVAEALETSGLRADLVTIEVTERRSPIELASARVALRALAALGIRLSWDDFGVGEASLSCLQIVHFDEIKIDRSFVQRADQDPTDRKICRFLAGLAHELDMQVVAEGVERQTVLKVVEAVGIDLAQGFAIHRPGSATSVPGLLSLDAAQTPDHQACQVVQSPTDRALAPDEKR